MTKVGPSLPADFFVISWVVAIFAMLKKVTLGWKKLERKPISGQLSLVLFCYLPTQQEE